MIINGYSSPIPYTNNSNGMSLEDGLNNLADSYENLVNEVAGDSQRHSNFLEEAFRSAANSMFMLNAEMQHRATSTVFAGDIKADEAEVFYTSHTVQPMQRFSPTTEENMKQLRSMLESGFGHLEGFSNIDWDSWEKHREPFVVKVAASQNTPPQNVINVKDIDMTQERERLHLMLENAQRQANTYVEMFLNSFKEHGAGAPPKI